MVCSPQTGALSTSARQGRRLRHATPAHLGQTILGNFRLTRVLGEGSFAVAYMAEQVGTDRQAVVKIAHPHLVRGDSGSMVRARFASEVRAATRVSHPNLVTVYTAGETPDGLPALAMEYLEGETLGKRLTRGERLSAGELRACFVQLASALTQVHLNNIVHRDVSPENVFLTRSHGALAVKLLDFGVARLLDREPSGKYTFGTPFYMAPEQIEGDASTASDVYAVGALLWWCLTGHELYAEIDNFPALVQRLRSQQQAPDPRLVNPALPARAARLLMAMLDHEPSRRPTMAGFGEEWAAASIELLPPESLTQRHVVTLMKPGPLADLVEGALRQGGHAVHRQQGVRVSELFQLARLDAVVLDADLPGLDPLALARSLGDVLPGVQLCVVSARPFAPAWSSVRARVLALLPEELAMLRGAIEDGEPISEQAPTSREHVHRVIGELPQLLAELEEASELRDMQKIVTLCERIERLSHLVLLRSTASLARTMRALAEGEALDDPAPFVDELLLSYQNAFRTLIAV